jgi:hypothetical protein
MTCNSQQASNGAASSENIKKDKHVTFEKLQHKIGLAELCLRVRAYYPERLRKMENDTLTTVGSMWSMLKCDYVTVMISLSVFQANPKHF